jgi:hypothetical protein
MAAPGLKLGGDSVGRMAALMVGAAVPMLLAWQLPGAGGAVVAVAAGGAVALAAGARALAPRLSGAGLAAVWLGAASLAGFLWR